MPGLAFDKPEILLLLLPIWAFVIWSGRPSRHRGSTATGGRPSIGGRSPVQRREWLSLALRLALITLLVLSLAGLQVVQADRRLTVVFLLDASDSVGPAGLARETDWVRQALAHLEPEDQAGVVVFGQQAMVERGVGLGTGLGPVTSQPGGSATDLEAAIRLGHTLLPNHGAQRLVLLSDGLETTGQADQAARLAAANGIHLDVVPITQRQGPEVALVSTVAPDTIRPGQAVDVTVQIDSTVATSSTVRILAGGLVVAEQATQVEPGSNRYRLTIPGTATATASGFAQFQVDVAAAQDSIPQNNSLSLVMNLAGPPQVLVVRQDAEAGQSQPLVAALSAAGLAPVAIDPRNLPVDPLGLAADSAVLLVNIPAPAMIADQVAALQSYVGDTGGGLVVIGGPNSYSVGGYYHTPLEHLLPLEMTLREPNRRPALTLLFVIDKSGSMNETSSGVAKIELAKEAVLRSLDLLTPEDRTGVIAFDTQANWVIPIGPVDLTHAEEAVGRLQASGGTDIAAGLDLAAAGLAANPTTVQHIILLTDGGAEAGSIPSQVAALHQRGTTVSVVAIGQSAAEFLKDLPRLGGGRYHFTPDPASIPQIFTEETALATRSYLIEEPTGVHQQGTHPTLDDLNQWPSLGGYVGASAKISATVELVSDQQDPLLATWQYGLGRVAAWTSDATNRWASQWVNWPDFPRFWEQIVRWAMQTGSNERSGQAAAIQLQTNITTEADRAILTIEAQDTAGSPASDLSLTGSVVGPKLVSETVSLLQQAPGRYTGEFVASEAGAYLLQISGHTGSGQPIRLRRGWSRPYSTEYQLPAAGADSGETRLRQLANLGSGSALAEPEAAASHDIPARPQAQDAWPWLLLAVTLLWPVDIALRRLRWTRVDLQRWQTRLADSGRALRSALTPTSVATSSSPPPRSTAPAEHQATPESGAATQPTLAARLLAARRAREAAEGTKGSEEIKE